MMGPLFAVRSVDLFAGGGGASMGIVQATGQAPLVAINHDPEAIAMHAQNHPGTLHLCEDVFAVEPFRPRGQSVDLLWASPDCKHFSAAKGGKPLDNKIRSLAWVVCEWAEAVRPSVICLENVREFADWGPLDANGRPIPERKGETFRAFVSRLEGAGYQVEHRLLVAADYGAPTTRRRLFLVARCDGQPIVWPEPTHGPGRAHPWRTAAECIDWSIPVPSIFDRARPLAEATQRRIAAGTVRYVLEDADPYIAPVGGAFFVSTRNGERKGQRPRARSLRDPMTTVTAQGSQGALAMVWLAKHYGGVVGHGMRRPLGTVTATDHHALVGVRVQQEPAQHAGKIATWIQKYYGQGAGQRADEPLHAIPARDRFGLVTVRLDGEEHIITDIGMRMLQPRELARAQGFPDDYQLVGTQRSQTARIGNSVVPQLAEAIVRAQFPMDRLPARIRLAC